MKKIFYFLIFAGMAHAGQIGIASHYSIKTNGGTHTASGQRLCDFKMTAAHPTLKMGTVVRVHNLNNNKKVILTINDRGPYAIKNGRVVRPLRPHPTRIIDVSQAAAKALDFHKNGLTKVKVEVVKKHN